MSDGEELFQKIFDDIDNSNPDSRCKSIAKHLKALGFDVRDGKRGGHKIFTHDYLSDFYSMSYNCGHGKNHEVKSAYIHKIKKALEMHKEDLVVFLDNQQEM